LELKGRGEKKVSFFFFFFLSIVAPAASPLGNFQKELQKRKLAASLA
jgi:hypothetical protein